MGTVVVLSNISSYLRALFVLYIAKKRRRGITSGGLHSCLPGSGFRTERNAPQRSARPLCDTSTTLPIEILFHTNVTFWSQNYQLIFRPRKTSCDFAEFCWFCRDGKLWFMSGQVWPKWCGIHSVFMSYIIHGRILHWITLIFKQCQINSLFFWRSLLVMGRIYILRFVWISEVS